MGTEGSHTALYFITRKKQLLPLLALRSKKGVCLLQTEEKSVSIVDAVTKIIFKYAQR